MSHVFTDYVRGLDPSGEPPDAETFDALRQALRRKLIRELKLRGIWDSPPSYLGVYGARHWSATPGRGGSDPLDELFAACYEFVFIRRLRNLLVHLRAKPSIDGLVTLNLRHFLFETQKRHDPLGYRVFSLVRTAVAEAVADGALSVLAGDSKIRNDTILGVAAEADATARSGARLDELARSWNDSLLPDMVTARGKGQRRIVDTLTGLLRRLPEQGVESFRFRDLVDPLKHDARQRWAARLAEEDLAADGEVESIPDLDAYLRPDFAAEQRESFVKLADCVTAAIDRSPAEATRSYLSALWEFLRVWAAEQNDDLPSRRQLAELLGIPRNRMPELFGSLGKLLRACQEATSATASVNLGQGVTSFPGMAMSQRSTEPALRRRTGEARRRHADMERKLDRGSGTAPRPGDLYLLAATAKLPVEWAILEPVAGDRRRFVAVPADASPIAGSADVVVAATAECAPLRLRCAFAAELDAGDLDPGMRTGSLPAEIVEQAREQRRVYAGVAVSDAGSMEYRDWVAEILEPARALIAADRVVADRVAADRVAADRVAAFRRRSRRFSIRPYAAAAAIILAAGLGFSGGLMWQRTTSPPAPRQPLTDVPFRAIFPAAASRGEPPTIVVPAAAEFLLLIVNVTEVETLHAYRLEIESSDGAGEPIWSGELRRSGQSLSVTWPTAWPAGDYRLRLYRPAGGAGEPLAEYRVRIEYDGS